MQGVAPARGQAPGWTWRALLQCHLLPSSLAVWSLSVLLPLPADSSYPALSFLLPLDPWSVGVYHLVSRLLQQSLYWLLPSFLFYSIRLFQSIKHVDICSLLSHRHFSDYIFSAFSGLQHLPQVNSKLPVFLFQLKYLLFSSPQDFVQAVPH